MCRAYSRKAHPEDLIHQEHKCARRSYATLIEIAKRCHWDGVLKSVDDKTVQMAHWYVSGDLMDGGKAHVLTLKVQQQDWSILEVVSNEDKSQALWDAFFPSLVQTDV